MICLCIWKYNFSCEGGLKTFLQWYLPVFFFGWRLGISLFLFCGSPSLLLVLPSGIPGCFTFLSLLVVVSFGHIHSALESIFVLTSMLLAPHKLISFGVSIFISRVFEAPFFKAVHFSAGYSWELLTRGIICSLFLEGGFRIYGGWFGILSMCVPKSSLFVVPVQVCEVNHILSCIGHGGVLDPLTLLTFHICKKLFAVRIG